MSQALGMYRNMLRLAQKVRPEAKRLEVVASVQREFRQSAIETNEEKIEELLNKANSSLGYLKMITPRSRATNKESGRTRIVFGEDGPREAKAVSNWTGSNMDPDNMKRHYNGLKRAGFTDNRSVVGDLF